MSRQVEAPVIDGLEFAREGRRLSGSLSVAALSRLADQLADGEGMLEWELRGERDRDGNAFLELRVAGSLNLRCQRCLEAVGFPLRLDSRLLLVPPGGAWPEDELVEDGFDAVEAGKEMALLPLIEDEVLLALPIAPRHEQCKPPAPLRDEQEPSPFAALGKLKKGV